MSEKLNVELKRAGRKKQRSFELADFYERSGKVKAKVVQRVGSCQDFLDFLQTQEETKLLYTWTCGDRLCLNCARNKSLKYSHRLQNVLNRVEIENPKKYRFLFMTLTLKNCKGEELKGTIDRMQDAFTALRKSQIFEAVEGYTRSLEITYNPETDTYHPHYHCVLMVSYKRYTKTIVKHIDGAKKRVPNPVFITSEKLWNAWGNALKVDYQPNVDIRAMRSIERKITAVERLNAGQVTKVHSGIREAVKYTLKDINLDIEKIYSDKNKDWIFEKKSEVIGTLYKALHNRRSFTLGGILQQLWTKEKELEKCAEIEEIDRYRNALEDPENKEILEKVEQAELMSYSYKSAVKEYQMNQTPQVLELHVNPDFREAQIKILRKERAKFYHSKKRK